MAKSLKYYEVLGLDTPPEDRKAVKRAYSKMLKVTRPEDDPDGFMRLRDAHDLALDIVAREAEQAAWQAEQAQYDTQPVQTEAAPKSGDRPLTYGDMIPDVIPGPDSNIDTGYSIGATANLDAPPASPHQTETPSDTSYSIGPTPTLEAPISFSQPEAPKAPPLIDHIDHILGDPKFYNDRENWNKLFREARQLDIDDYVEFERLLLNAILDFHGYFEDDNPHYNTPEKLPQKLSPSLAASLFKTMNWDQVHKQGYHRAHQIDWLERRMMVRKRRPDAVPIPETNSAGNGKVWLWVIGTFAVLKIIQLLANI